MPAAVSYSKMQLERARRSKRPQLCIMGLAFAAALGEVSRSLSYPKSSRTGLQDDGSFGKPNYLKPLPSTNVEMQAYVATQMEAAEARPRAESLVADGHLTCPICLGALLFDPETLQRVVPKMGGQKGCND